MNTCRNLASIISDAAYSLHAMKDRLIILSVLQAFNGLAIPHNEISERLYVIGDEGLEPLLKPIPDLTELFVAVKEMPIVPGMCVERYLMKIEETQEPFFHEDHRVDLIVDPDIGYQKRTATYSFYRVSIRGHGPDNYSFTEERYLNPDGQTFRFD